MHSDEVLKGALPKGRKRTDRSLEAERAKADKSLLAGRKQTEKKTDEAVLVGRAGADEVRSKSRIDADESSDVDRAAPGGSRSGDRLDSDERLREERETADNALDAERRHVDSILDAERVQKGIDEGGRFEAERTKTDSDLTSERRQTDVEVDRAATALTTRDEFLAIVSHDLRNPLGAISMAAHMLAASPTYSTADKETRQYLEMIERNAGEALRLIGDLMDMERIAAGKIGLQIQKYDVIEIIQNSVQSFQHLASSKNIAIKVDPENIGFRVMCDRDRIAQVLSNLIGNAIKFSPNQGVVAVAAHRRERDVEICVSDNGPGIPEDMKMAIFSRFWQIGKQDRRGLGLGLYIAKMIVEAHGGRLWVESEVGNGSRFRFTLQE